MAPRKNPLRHPLTTVFWGYPTTHHKKDSSAKFVGAQKASLAKNAKGAKESICLVVELIDGNVKYPRQSRGLKLITAKVKPW